jgi:hypothetical protein
MLFNCCLACSAARLQVASSGISMRTAVAPKPIWKVRISTQGLMFHSLWTIILVGVLASPQFAA